jgi:hypothetical protein
MIWFLWFLSGFPPFSFALYTYFTVEIHKRLREFDEICTVVRPTPIFRHPFFQKTVFFSKICFGNPPSKFLEVYLNSEYRMLK